MIVARMPSCVALVRCALVLAPLAAAAQERAPDGAGEAGNQIRLDRPAGGGGQPTLPGQGVGPPSLPGQGDSPPTIPGQGGSGRGAGAEVLMDVSPAESLRIFRSAGFSSVELVADKGTDFLRLRFDNAMSFIFHANCTDGRCRSLMFTAFLDGKRGASLNFVNGYNVKTMHTKMARNDAGEIVLTMAASVSKGVTAEHLRALGAFWMQVHREAVAWR